MIIAFYPGAGGNRFLQLMLGNNWNQHGVSYDKLNQQELSHRYLLTGVAIKADGHILTHCMNSQLIQSKFPGQSIVFIKSERQKSLCREWMLHGHSRYMSTVDHSTLPRLEHYNAVRDPSWPEISSLSKLESLPANILDEVNNDYQRLVQKKVSPETKIEKLTLECVEKIHSAYENIVWHKNYYNQYPEDFSMAHQIINIDHDQTEFSIFMKQELALYFSELYNKAWSVIYE